MLDEDIALLAAAKNINPAFIELFSCGRLMPIEEALMARHQKIVAYKEFLTSYYPLMPQTIDATRLK